VKVAWLYVAPVKSLAVEERASVDIRDHGVDGDREFCLIGADGRLLNGKRLGPVNAIRARFDAATSHLELRMPNGAEVEGVVRCGEAVAVTISGNQAPAHVVEGPWAEALTAEIGRPIRLVRLDRAGDGVDRASKAAGVTLLSRGSLERLAEVAGLREPVDARRFRMLIGIEDASPHEEDGWIGKRVRIGEAVVVPGGNVGRCVVTTMDPDTGESDLDTLEVLARYRRDVPSSEALSFGVWARVERAGRVAIGDDIAVLED
jgi:uncharacterized protein YcbX